MLAGAFCGWGFGSVSDGGDIDQLRMGRRIVADGVDDVSAAVGLSVKNGCNVLRDAQGYRLEVVVAPRAPGALATSATRFFWCFVLLFHVKDVNLWRECKPDKDWALPLGEVFKALGPPFLWI